MEFCKAGVCKYVHLHQYVYFIIDIAKKLIENLQSAMLLYLKLIDTPMQQDSEHLILS